MAFISVIVGKSNVVVLLIDVGVFVYRHSTEIGVLQPFQQRFNQATSSIAVDNTPFLAYNPLATTVQQYLCIFDLCIESLSNSTKKEIERDTIHKKLEYAQAGVGEYFILDENGIDTAFYQLGHNGLYVPIPAHNGIIHSQVLPGFQFRESDLYTLPEPPQLIDDPVYRHYSSPFVRAERIRAEQAEERAAQAEQQVAEYAALLRSHGITLPRS